MAKAKTLFVKRGGALHPADAVAQEAFDRIPDGTVVELSITRPRNERQHRLYWALLGICIEMQPGPNRFPNKDVLHETLKVATGYYVTYKIGNRDAIKILSTSYESMDQQAFREYFDRVADLMCKHILPGMEAGDLKDAAYEMCGVPREFNRS